MFDLDTWQEVFSTLRKNVLRTVMTAWGVFWGAFMLVLMLGFGTGLQSGVSENMLGFAGNNVYAWGNRTRLPYQGLALGRRVQLNTGDIAALRAQVPELEALDPAIELGGWRDGNNVTRGGETGNFGVQGRFPEAAKVEHIVPYTGRFINDLDIKSRRKTAVIGEAVRRILFKDDEAPIGEFIKIRGVFFQVVGIVKSEEAGQSGDRNDNRIIIPFTSFQTAFNTRDDVGWFGLRLSADADPEQTEASVLQILRTNHRVHPDDRDAVGSYNQGKRFGRVENLFRGIRLFVWFVCATTLLAGALGVSNIMLISVKERTREFGVRKAIGASPGSIVRLVLQEATVLTALAGYLGIVVGVLLLELFPRMLATDSGPMGAPSIDLSAALIAVLVLAVSGAIAGVAPARHAASIQPVVALRSE